MPAEPICQPPFAAPKFHDFEVAPVLEVTPDVSITEFPFWSSRSVVTVEVAPNADPLNVMVRVLTAIPPAASDENVIVPRSSIEVLLRVVVFPSDATESVSLLRNSVMVLVFGNGDEFKVTEDDACEVLPKATTASAVVLFVESVDVAILKTCVLLSVAPDEAYDATSPFNTKDIEFP